MWWQQTPASAQEIPLCSTPGEDGGRRKKAPRHLLARRERKVSRPQAGPKWNLRSRSWEAIWGSAWVARPFLPLALGLAKFRRVLPLPLPEYRLTRLPPFCLSLPSLQTPGSSAPWQGSEPRCGKGTALGLPGVWGVCC